MAHYLVRVVGNQKTFVGRVFSFFRLILSKLGIRVGLGSLEEFFLSAGPVLLFSFPLLDGAVLQGSSVGEADAPRVLELVHFIEVDGGLFFALASAEELGEQSVP